ncbi:hypothetical protein EVAR_83436_1 [Eumeta japonica]|uniref:Uncharacterized protein n=1 Tax=Eumeta variegata TaxID=151549 RepID=A0A4C1TYG8_EUMVA|nr:hypothetical protein EVAR_83436_1 [Eumeta japonica]
MTYEITRCTGSRSTCANTNASALVSKRSGHGAGDAWRNRTVLWAVPRAPRRCPIHLRGVFRALELLPITQSRWKIIVMTDAEDFAPVAFVKHSKYNFHGLSRDKSLDINHRNRSAAGGWTARADSVPEKYIKVG